MTDVIAPYLPHSGTSLAAAQALTRERVARQAGEPEWLQPRCPRCEAPLRCRSYEAAGCGVVFIWECERSAGPRPACEYRRVLF